MLKKLSTKKGFTLIEIIIALAIAALIIVIVLLGVNGAQRSQRNDARRSIADKTRAAIQDASANNAGAQPSLAQVNSALPAAEKTLNGVVHTAADGGAFPAGCTPSGVVNVNRNLGAFEANICLEGGANYVSR